MYSVHPRDCRNKIIPKYFCEPVLACSVYVDRYTCDRGPVCRARGARFSRLVTVSGPPRAAGASAASAPAGAHASGTKLGTKEQGATFN